MDWVNILTEVISQFIALYKGLVEVLRFFVIDPWRNSPEFGQGFITGSISAGIVGSIASLLMFWRAQIRHYFSPIQLPSTKPGPRPFDIYLGCLGGLMKLILAGIVLLILVTAFATALS